MTPDQIQTKLNELQAELDKLKQLPDGMIGNSSDSHYVDNDHYIPQPGEVVEAGDSKKNLLKRIFVEYRNETDFPFICIAKSQEDKYRKGENYDKIDWKFCRRLSGEIIEFGCDKPKTDNPVTYGTMAFEIDLTNLESKIEAKVKPDYTHLLPTGYEFCEEGEHTGWVKIRLIGDEGENKLGYSFYGLDCANKPYYRPIRPIQYHVQVHEAVTVTDEPIKVAEYYQPLFDLLHKDHNVIATQSELDEIIRTAGGLGEPEPNPYSVDWANAPDDADVHAFDSDNRGCWHCTRLYSHFPEVFIGFKIISGHTLPTGLDWKLSKTVRPR